MRYLFYQQHQRVFCVSYPSGCEKMFISQLNIYVIRISMSISKLTVGMSIFMLSISMLSAGCEKTFISHGVRRCVYMCLYEEMCISQLNIYVISSSNSRWSVCVTTLGGRMLVCENVSMLYFNAFYSLSLSLSLSVSLLLSVPQSLCLSVSLSLSLLL